jgi:hypothetical protein
MMLHFVIYGIENDRFNRLRDELISCMEGAPIDYSINQVTDIDSILKAGVVSIPSIYVNNNFIVEDAIPKHCNLKCIIGQSISSQLKPEHQEFFQ